MGTFGFLGFGAFILFITWNVLAVIGLITVIRWISNRNTKIGIGFDGAHPKGSEGTLSASSKEAHPTNSKTAKPVSTKSLTDFAPVDGSSVQKKSSRGTKTSAAEVPNKNERNPLSLLYTGAFLVGFAIFILVAFNWYNYSDGVKSFLIIAINATLVGITALFANRIKYRSVYRTMLALTCASLAFSVEGIWKFMLADTVNITREMFYTIYLSGLTGLYYFIAHSSKSFFYFLFGTIALMTTVVISSENLNGAISNQLIWIAILNTVVYLIGMNYKEEYTKNAHTLISIGTNIVLTVVTLVFIAATDPVYSQQSNRVIVGALVLILAIYYVITNLHKRNIATSIASGIYVPFAALALIKISFIGADLYDYIAGVIVVMAETVLMERFIRQYDPTKYHLAFRLATGGLILLILSLYTPAYLVQWSAVPMLLAATTMYFIVSYHVSKSGRRWLKLIPNLILIPLFLSLSSSITQLADIDSSSELLVAVINSLGAFFVLDKILWKAHKGSYMSYSKLEAFGDGALLASLGFVAFIGEAARASYEPSRSIEILFIYLVVAVFFYTLARRSKQPIWGYILGVVGPMSAFPIAYAIRESSLIDLSGNSLIDTNYASLTMLLGSLVLVKIVHLEELVNYMRSEFFNLGDQFAKVKRSSLLVYALFILIAFGELLGNSEISNIFILPMIALSIYAYRWNPRGGGIHNSFVLPLILVVWRLISISDTPAYANAHLYTMPVVLYLLWLSYVYQHSRKMLAMCMRYVGLTIPMLVFLVQSITEPEEFRIYHGILLIIYGSALLVYGYIQNDRWLKIIAIVGIVIELIIRLWDIIVEIPWWVYVGLIGTILISIATSIISRSTNESVDDTEVEGATKEIHTNSRVNENEKLNSVKKKNGKEKK